MKTPIKQTAHRLAASLAIITALATTGAWAGYVWTGEGADEYYDTANNKANGPSGRGVYFVDGIEDNGGVMRYASNSTVRFNSYTLIGGAPVRIGRASQTDSDKIWTFIPDNDECGFYLDSGYDLEVGYNVAYGDGYLRMLNGKLAARRMYIGPNANDPTTKGVLSIGSADRAATIAVADYIEIRNGELTTTNTALTCGGNLTAANKSNSSVTIDKTGGDWCVGNLAMNTADGTTATFYNRGGNLVVTNDLTVQNRGSGEFYMEGGHVTVSNIVRFGDYNLNSGDVGNLYLNGGVFEAKIFRFHNAANWQTYGYVVLNGGTYKAMADGSMALNTGDESTDGRKGAVNMLHFKVGERGGTIDTAGYDVVFPLRLLQDSSSNGGIVVKGGGSLTLENAKVTYVGKTSVEAGTTLVVSDSTAKSNILSHGIELAGAPTPGTSYTVFRCNDDLTTDDLANVTCGAASDFTPAVGEDGKSIVVTATALKSGYWTGAANDGNLSNGFNWTDGNVPTSGNAEICCPVATTLTVGGTFSPDTITIPDGSALVTIGSGTLYVNEVVNRQLLAVGAGATVVIGDRLTLAKGESLCDQNNGTLVVSNLLLKAESGDRYVTTNQTTSSSGVFKFDTVTNAMTGNWFFMVDHHAVNPYEFYIGAGGLNFQDASGTAGYAIGRNDSGNSTTTIRPWYSDFTIADRGSGSRSLILLHDITFCTDDESGVGRTITIDANTRGHRNPVITVSGSGTLKVNGTCDNSNEPTVTVTDTATLAFGADASLGTGDITLGAGTTLALTATSSTYTFANTLNLPTGENEVATIRIDGTRLCSGDQEIATVGNEATTANVALDPASLALNGRKGSLRVEDGKLILKVIPSGLMLIFR